MLVSDHKYISIWFLPQQGKERIAIKPSYGRNIRFINFTRESVQACFKRGTLQWKAGKILAESCIKLSSAVRRSCIGHFSYNRGNEDEGTEKQMRKEPKEELSCSGPQNQRVIDRR